MAIVNFLFGNRTSSGFAIEGAVSFEADLTMEELHERSAEVTQHPVESGGTISDHVILQPERLRLDGFVTDARLRDPEATRTQSAFADLDTAWSSGQLVQVITARKTYQDMVITRLDLPYDRPESMEFSVELQQVKIVDAQEVEGILPADTEETTDLVTPEQETGNQSAPLVEEGSRDAEQAQSTAASVIDRITGSVDGVEESLSGLPETNGGSQ